MSSLCYCSMELLIPKVVGDCPRCLKGAVWFPQVTLPLQDAVATMISQTIAHHCLGYPTQCLGCVGAISVSCSKDFY